MPIYYGKLPNNANQPNDIDVPVSLGEALSTRFSQDYDQTAIGASQRIGRGLSASGGKFYDPKQAQEFLGKAGVMVEAPANGASEGQLNYIVEQQKRNIARQKILDRAPTGFANNTALFLSGVASNAPDIAAFFGVSLLTGGAGIAPAWAARVAASTAPSVLRRGVSRVAIGAVEGAAGTAALQPLVATADYLERTDYTMNNALLNTVFGGLTGGVLYGAGGVVGDKLGISKYAKMNARLREFRIKNETGLNMPDIAPNNPEAVFSGARPVEKAAAADAVLHSWRNDLPVDASTQIPDLYKHVDAPDSLAARFDDDTLNAIRSNKGVPRNLQRPVGIVDFIRQNGGINDDSPTFRGEIRNVLGDKGKSRPGLINNKAGASLDELALLAQDAGFFPEKPLFELGQVTPDELVAAIRKELNGQRVYRPDDPRAKPYEDAQAYSTALDGLERVLGENGIDTRLSNEDIRQALRQRDLEAIDRLDRGDFPVSYADDWDNFKSAGIVGDDLPITPDEFYKAKAGYDALMRGKTPPSQNYSPEYLKAQDSAIKTTGTLPDIEEKTTVIQELLATSSKNLDLPEELRSEVADLLKSVGKEKKMREKALDAVSSYTRCILGGIA